MRQSWWHAGRLLHGGPGAGPANHHRRFFDPARWHVVLFDRRGAGKSTPFAGLEANTTQDLAADIGRIRHIPGVIVHGRCDLVCPVQSAFDLHEAWPEAAFHGVLAGHAATGPAIVDRPVEATDRFADRMA